MTQNNASHWYIGLFLAISTVLFWATLPVALELALDVVDPVTLTWTRFIGAFFLTLAWQSAKGNLAKYQKLNSKQWLQLGLAGFLLIGNYVGYIKGLEYTTPANAQILIQLAPILMALGGMLFFKERFNTYQWVGFTVLIAGLLLFFQQQLHILASSLTTYKTGVLIMLFAAITWAAYALLQKGLHKALSSQLILLFIYGLATLVLWPFSHPSELLSSTPLQSLMIIYAVLNTIGAYGAFALSLHYWEASRVSAVLSLTPLGTILFVSILAIFWPRLLQPEQLDIIAWAGAFMVVIGSMTVSLAKK
ncbi:MAG: DMT family transporter [bacterium]